MMRWARNERQVSGKDAGCLIVTALPRGCAVTLRDEVIVLTPDQADDAASALYAMSDKLRGQFRPPTGSDGLSSTPGA